MLAAPPKVQRNQARRKTDCARATPDALFSAEHLRRTQRVDVQSRSDAVFHHSQQYGAHRQEYRFEGGTVLCSELKNLMAACPESPWRRRIPACSALNILAAHRSVRRGPAPPRKAHANPCSAANKAEKAPPEKRTNPERGVDV